MNRKTIDTSDLPERFSSLLDQLNRDGLIITRQGEPVARVVPYEIAPGPQIGRLKDKVEVRGNLLSTSQRFESALPGKPRSAEQQVPPLTEETVRRVRDEVRRGRGAIGKAGRKKK